MSTAWSRRLFLLRTLLQRGAIQTHQAAALLDVDRRTALKDLKQLEAHGVPLRKSDDGQHERWVLMSAWRHAGLDVDIGDRLALLFGRELVGAFMRGTELEASVARLSSTLRALDPEAPASDAELRRRFFYVHEPEKDYQQHRSVVAGLIDAILRSRRVSFDYTSGRDGTEQRFERACPLTLATYRRSLYLFFRPSRSNDVLRKPIERMRDMIVERMGFDYPAAHEYDPARELAGVFGIAGGEHPVDQVRLRFAPEVAALVRPRQWMAEGGSEVEPLPDGGCRLILHARGVELVSWVLSFGDKVVVEAPGWLRTEVVQELRGALASYGE